MRKNIALLSAVVLAVLSCNNPQDYRNVALMKAASHSSSWDLNQTAQLVTDGLLADKPAPWVDVRLCGQEVGVIERNYLTDFNISSLQVRGEEGTFELYFHGIPFQADRLVAVGRNLGGNTGASLAVAEVSADGKGWTEAGRAKCGKPNNNGILYKYTCEWDIPLANALNPAAVKVDIRIPGATGFEVYEFYFYKGDQLLELTANRDFQSVWKSAGSTDEWIEVDLGAPCRVDKAVFHWLNPPFSGSLLASRDGRSWKKLADIDGQSEVTFKKTSARYFRTVLYETLNGKPFELSEWELWGAGPRQKAEPKTGDISWKLVRDDGKSAWIDAVVPGTVLSSYIAAGAVHHPNFGTNQSYISDSYFRSDFLYRGTFEASTSSPRQFLNFDGINFQAQVSLNGEEVGFIGSAFDACSFDVTGILREGTNVVDVRILHNPHYGIAKQHTPYTPDKNGGVLGADNPTMHATIGWDWIPTVRGRNVGIYDKVYLTYKGDVSVEEPFVRSQLPLPDTTRATVFASARITNRGQNPVSGVLQGRFGDFAFGKEEALAPGESRIVQFDPLAIENPRLWWPNGYGKQELYPVSFEFVADGEVSDSVSFLSGIRQMDCYLEPYKSVSGSSFEGRNQDQRLCMYVNGRRFIGFGGNWGYPEHLLEYTDREYDIAVGNHADMNFTMIRDWVGMTDNKAFYDACDRYGIMVWQDFWLANPWDGPDPSDPARFNEVATRYVRRIRNHPSIALYVGRNEGYPPEEIDSHLREMIPQEHPGMLYIPHSAADGVSGGGPYNAKPVKEYFNMNGHDKMHSERGMPAVMNYENMVRAFGKESVEPVSTIAHPNLMYGIHDYTLGRLAGTAQETESFNEMLEKAFGEPADAREFAYLAQWINYDGYRAMFESRSEYRRGLLLWMSHPAWPSMVWQTYDYYFEPTGAYFGCKKACEPMHIQMNPLKGTVEVVNYHAGPAAGLTAKAQILNMDGSVAWSRDLALDIAEDQTITCFPLEVPEDVSEAYFVKLELADSLGRCISDNFYWKGLEEGNVKALRTLEKTRVELRARKSSAHIYTVALENKGAVPALMIRLKVLDSATGDLILPVRYSDNYFFLLPGQGKTVEVSFESCTGKPVFRTEGLNI